MVGYNSKVSKVPNVPNNDGFGNYKQYMWLQI